MPVSITLYDLIPLIAVAAVLFPLAVALRLIARTGSAAAVAEPTVDEDEKALKTGMVQVDVPPTAQRPAMRPAGSSPHLLESS